VFISDVHLSSRDCKAEELLSFLDGVSCDNLYVVGDFFDIWLLSRRWHWPPIYNQVIRRILGMVRAGTRVVFVPGNHDEIFRHYAGHDFGGVEIMLRTTHETADGRKLLVTHGDEFDTIVKFNKWLAMLGSTAYDYLIYANRPINALRSLWGLKHWSLASYLKHRIKSAGAYVKSFETALVAEAKHLGMAGVVCGHIHTPDVRDVGGILYCNCGDWIDACTALVEDDYGNLAIFKHTS